MIGEKIVKREFLKGLLKGVVPDDQLSDLVDKIMDENGTDINVAKKVSEATVEGFKKKISELENAKTEVETERDNALNNLKTFDGVNVKELQDNLKKAQDDLAAAVEEHNAKISGLEFDAALQAQMSELKFSSDYAKTGVFSEIKSRVEFKEGKLSGYEEALKEIQEKQPAAFTTIPEKNNAGNEGKPHAQTKTQTGNSEGLLESLRGKYNV